MTRRAASPVQARNRVVVGELEQFAADWSAVLAEAHFLLHGWLWSGNCGTARGAVEFLKEALALLPEKHTIRVGRADAGFFVSSPWGGGTVRSFSEITQYSLA